MNVDALISDFAARLRSGEPLPILHKPFDDAPLRRTQIPPPPIAEAQHRIASLNVAQTESLDSFLESVASRALSKAQRANGRATGKGLTYAAITKAFKESIAHHSDQLDRLARKRPTPARVIKECDVIRRKARKDLAAELLSAKIKLRALKEAIRVSDARLSQSATIEHENSGQHINLYPEITRQAVQPHQRGDGLPSVPGIYFLWLNGQVEYVGQSVCIANRVRLGTHHVLHKEHTISYVLIDREKLMWAESYFIGILRPTKNRGTPSR
jgi:hypothetical protein